MSSMVNSARVPDATQMRRYLDKGLTQQAIADQWEKDSNLSVGRSAIGLAIARYGLESAHPRKRFGELIPWSVAPEHRQHRDIKMLRLEGRRREGLSMSEADELRLSNWRKRLDEADAVIMYHPDTDQGFWWVSREERDEDIVRMPEE